MITDAADAGLAARNRDLNEGKIVGLMAAPVVHEDSLVAALKRERLPSSDLASLRTGPPRSMKQLTAQSGCFKLAFSPGSAAARKAASICTLTMLQMRSEPRTAHESSVRVFGMDSAGRPINQTGWTVDISQRGERLKGLPFWNGPGETIGVRQGTEKARFRVVWTGKPGTPQEGQVGLLCIDTGKYIWGITAPTTEARTRVASAGTAWPGARRTVAGSGDAGPPRPGRLP